ncbi:hypothetical protein [Deinococcus altitudinis]|uniref:hypothetical protein n=1 Tax=Deinococcus altitudinis TaxID=468914 RepID=UPI0038926F80
MLRTYCLVTTAFVFALGLFMTLRNWRLTRRFRDQGLALMALAGMGFLVASLTL